MMRRKINESYVLFQITRKGFGGDHFRLGVSLSLTVSEKISSVLLFGPTRSGDRNRSKKKN